MTTIGNQINLIQEMMSRAQEQQRVISHNIANVNTPNYRAQDIRFSTALQDILAGKESNATNQAGTTFEVQGLMVREDGNTVDIDRELVNLDKNMLMFKSYSEMLVAKLSMLRTAISSR